MVVVLDFRIFLMGRAISARGSRGCRCIFHRLGWHRLGYGEMTEELRVPCDHLEKLHFCAHQY